MSQVWLLARVSDRALVAVLLLITLRIPTALSDTVDVGCGAACLTQ